MPDRKFDLGDYVEVKDRIKLFYELFGQGRLVTGEVRVTSEPDGVPRVWVQGFAYRTPDDPLPGVGWSWMILPGSTSYTKGSELENTETSAWGRAIGSLGILIDRSIASAQEVDNKAGEKDRPEPPKSSDPYTEQEELTGRVRRRGIIRKGSAEGYKLDARIGPEGHAIGFRLEIDGDKAIPQCVVAGPLGEALYQATGEHPETLLGIPATVAGILYHVKSPKASWYRLHVDAIETTINGLDVILPASDVASPPTRPSPTQPSIRSPFPPPAPDESALPEPPEDAPLLGEAESAPLGLVS